MRLLTLPGVFRPRSDSWLLAEAIAAHVSPATSVLDPFTGSGVLAIAAARAGAREVTAVDVSRRAALSARLGARLNGVRIRALRGDLFGPVAGERFDLVVANPPYLPAPEADPPPRGRARAWEGGADGRVFLDRLCMETADHLHPGGALLLVQSSVCGVEPTVERLRDGGLDAEIVARRTGPLGPLLRRRAAELEERGILRPGQRDEELVVVRATISRSVAGGRR